jgi:hypothetical protein
MKDGHRLAKGRVPNRISVDSDQIAKMQAGYEDRIARQKSALDRIVNLLEQRTQDVTDHMRRANDAARYMVDGLDVANTEVADIRERESTHADAFIDQVFSMVPKEYDLYNEDDTRLTIVMGYIRHLEDSVKALRVKLIQEQDKNADLQAQANQSNFDARHNAKMVNKAMSRLDITEQTPVWADEEKKPEVDSGSHQADHTGTPVWSNDPAEGDRETLDWSGATSLMLKGEQRPGSF